MSERVSVAIAPEDVADCREFKVNKSAEALSIARSLREERVHLKFSSAVSGRRRR